jgi:chorismate synthase
MAGNSFGKYFRVTTFGESHGAALGAVVDGCPPGVALSREEIQRDLDRRRPGQSQATTGRQEADAVEVLSGLLEGRTTGTPIALLIRNRDADPSAYDRLKDVFRPGHADLTYFLKYGLRDHRGGGRASGRETAARVAAGAVARAVLRPLGVEVFAWTVQVGPVIARGGDFAEVEKNALRCPDPEAAAKMMELIRACKEQGDSIGGAVQVVAEGVPAGLGDPVFAKLDADIAGALMSIGAVKGVEIGAGFGFTTLRGSEASDPFTRDETGAIRSRRNLAGGILGGISTGEPITATIAVKPTSSISREQSTIGRDGRPATITVTGRHDPCLCPRIVPVAEAMLLLVLSDHLLAQRAQTGQAGPVGRIGTE